MLFPPHELGQKAHGPWGQGLCIAEQWRVLCLLYTMCILEGLFMWAV